MPKKRFPTNVVIFSATTVTLLLTVTLTNCFVVEILNDLPADLNSFNFRSDMPNYTDYVDNNTYISGNVVFEPNVMAGFYRLTQNFMNSVLEPNFLKVDQIQWKSSGSGFTPELSDDVSISDLLNDYWVLVFIIILTLLITLLIPISGLVFCCCRCCGNCGAKSKPSDAKKDYSKKVVAGALTIVLGTILLMTVVCAFATNHDMHKGTTDFPQNIRKTYSDANSFLASLEGQADTLLDVNFKQFSTVFKTSLRDSGTNVLENMTSWNNASAMLDLNNFVVKMPEIKIQLQKLNDKTDLLKQQVSKVNEDLTNIKASLTSTLNECSAIATQCEQANEQISSIEFNIDVTQIPNVTLAIQQLGGLEFTQLEEAAKAGKAKLDGLRSKINSTLSDNIDNVCQQIDNAGTTIKENKQDMINIKNDLRDQINNVNNTLENAYGYITEYSPYFYYVGLILSCILLLIPVCIVLGLLWGICGKRPEKHETTSCSKETGSVFLISGVLFIFIFTILLGALTCVMLIFGLAVDRVICYPLRNPEQSSVINIIDTYIAKNNYVNFNVSINGILVGCSNDESLYKVFNLSSKFNLDELNTKFDINGTVTSIIEKITTQATTLINPDTFNILNPDDLQKLERLADVNPDINVAGFENQLNQSLPDLQPIKRSLEEIRNLSVISESVKSKITTDILQIEEVSTTLQSMLNTTKETLELARKLDNDLKMNHSNFSEAINTFLTDVTTAQQQLKDNSTEIVLAAGQFAKLVQSQALGYLQRVIDVLENDLGRCGPLNVAFNSALIATCDQIFMPWNGFWVALFISLLVFVPTLIVSIALASLYKNYKFTGPNFKPDKSSMKKNQNPRGQERDSPKSRYDDMAPSFIMG